jgi:hypothetical protein
MFTSCQGVTRSLIADHKDVLIGDFQNLLDFDKDEGLLLCTSTSLPFLIPLANPLQTDTSVPKLHFPSSSLSPTSRRWTDQDYRRLTQITPLALLSYPDISSLPRPPRQPLSPYSPCAAFIPKLLFPSSSHSPQRLSIRVALQMALLSDLQVSR